MHERTLHRQSSGATIVERGRTLLNWIGFRFSVFGFRSAPSEKQKTKPKTVRYLMIRKFVGAFGGMTDMICTIVPPV